MPSKINRKNFMNTELNKLHDGLTFTASQNVWSPFISCEGYDKLALHLLNDASTSSLGSIEWSMDGTTSLLTTEGNVIANNTNQKKTAITDVKAPYFRLVVANGDTASHVITTWYYLR